MATDSAIAAIGRLVKDRAADAGPTMRLNTSSAPTTGSAMAVARASTPRNTKSIMRGETLLAAPRSPEIELNSSGRKQRAIRATTSRLMARTGGTSAALTPMICPNNRP